MKEEIDLLILYRNYLSSLQIREEMGEQYGDTQELIQMYEEKLGKYLVKKKETKKE